MARQAIENQQVTFMPGDGHAQNLLCDVKHLVFQQATGSQQVADELELSFIQARPGPQVGAEIEVQALPTGPAVTLQPIPQRALAAAGRAEEQDRFHAVTLLIAWSKAQRAS